MKKVIVSGIKMPPRHIEDEVYEKARAIFEKNGIDWSGMAIHKKSLDARRKGDIHFEYSVIADAKSFKMSGLDKNLRFVDDVPTVDFEELRKASSKNKRIIVVGTGPCGLFAAYVLAYCGADVTVVERGSQVEKRCDEVNNFWKTGILNPRTNIQFGEGGAGTFSDGKLTTRIGDPLQKFVLEMFAECGAPEEIVYQAKPHIGTDFLKICVRNLREKIRGYGGKVIFDCCMTDIKTENGKITGIRLDNGGQMDCDALVIAIGHSSRDTYEMLHSRGVAMEQKPFAAGVRIEHRREFINKMQYGKCSDLNILPTADYRLAFNGETRSCYSFCMCPGGVVVNASSELEHLVVNGMSDHSRMADNSNSALVVSVKPEDFDGDSPLAGIEFQRKYEALAYKMGRGNAPVQLARDFLENKTSQRFDGVIPSFTGNTEFANLNDCLPEFISKTLGEGLRSFEEKIKGFSSEGAILTGVEMRTSAPLRIKRDENFESISHRGLYPAGEGAGYAGGIMSAAIDGIRVAVRILEQKD